MLKVKVKTDKVSLFIPVPYALLYIGVSIVSSKLLNRQINKWTKEHAEEKEMVFTIPQLDKIELRKIVKELRNTKGIELVNVKTHDGTEVRIIP